MSSPIQNLIGATAASAVSIPPSSIQRAASSSGTSPNGNQPLQQVAATQAAQVIFSQPDHKKTTVESKKIEASFDAEQKDDDSQNGDQAEETSSLSRPAHQGRLDVVA